MPAALRHPRPGFTRGLFACLIPLIILGCQQSRSAVHNDSCEPQLNAAALHAIDLAPVSTSSQVLLVIAEDDSQHATAWLLERDASASAQAASLQPAFRIVVGPIHASVGARGFAPPGQKREGDRRSPTGAFPLPESYSSDPASVSKLAHRVVTEQDAICEDPHSPQYNRWITLNDPNLPPWTPSERDMMELGVIVDYNRDPVVPGAGSGILIHAANPGPDSAGTYGCVGLSKTDLRTIVSRLDDSKRPMILMGRRTDLSSAPDPGH